MKIFDCTTFFNEKMMMDLRFNILNEHVSKFIVVESIYSHSGKKKSLNFNIDDYPNVKIKGLMGMASFSYDEELIKKQFTLLNKIYQKFKNRFAFEYLSMGMSGDYKIALNCNSNMIRLGSNIFGKR